MLPRYSNELNARLEQVADIGCVVIRKAELLRWHEKERLTKSVWKNVYDKWLKIEEDNPLLVGDGEGIITLIDGQGLITTADGWWNDMRKWAGNDFEIHKG